MPDQFQNRRPVPPPEGGWGGPPVSPPEGGWDAPARRPPPVTNAVRLMFVQGGLSAIILIVLFATKDELKKRILEASPNTSNSSIDAALRVGTAFSVVFIVLYALLAIQVGRGKNWARKITWVLGGITILSGLVGLGQPAPPLSRALAILSLVIAIAIVVFLALYPSNRWFRSRG